MRPLALALVALLAACGNAPPRPAASSTMVVLDPADERILNPVWDMPAKFLLFAPLVGGPRSNEPRLARRWEHSDDYRTWTFHLRGDVRWHDGVPVTAHDVEFSMRLLSHPDIAYYGGWESFQVPDDTTLIVTFKRPVGSPEGWTVFFPKHLLEDLDPSTFFDWDFWRRPVGNGPYRFVRMVPRTLVELEANPDYFLGEPKIERLIIKFGGSEPLTELLSGNVDALMFVSRADLPKLRADPRFRVYHGIWYDVAWLEAIFWNHANPLFADARVRRALTMAIDRQELRRLQNLPDSLPIFDILFTGRQLWAGDLPDPLPHDPAAAGRLLSEAGWRDSDGDGVLERDGRPFRFTALVASGGAIGTAAFGQAAVYVQERLARLGVRMEIEPVQSGIQQRLRAGDFEAAFHRFFSHPNGQAEAFGLDGFTGWRDARMIAALERLQDAWQPTARDAVYRELMPVFQAEVPITFLAPQVQYFVAHRRVKGLESPFRARPLMHAEHLWLEEER